MIRKSTRDAFISARKASHGNDRSFGRPNDIQSHSAKSFITCHRI